MFPSRHDVRTLSWERPLPPVVKACEAGASGFIVGRTLWNNVLRATDKAESVEALELVSLPLLERLGARGCLPRPASARGADRRAACRNTALEA